jgi:hypothetical protein
MGRLLIPRLFNDAVLTAEEGLNISGYERESLIGKNLRRETCGLFPGTASASAMKTFRMVGYLAEIRTRYLVPTVTVNICIVTSNNTFVT